MPFLTFCPQAFIYDIVQHLYFKRFIAVLVLVNSFLLSVKWEEDKDDIDGDGDEDEDDNAPVTFVTFAYASSALTVCFVVEVIMKMIAFTPYGYWQSRRNRGDLLVTILGVAWIVLNYVFNNQYTLTFGYVVIILRLVVPPSFVRG